MFKLSYLDIQILIEFKFTYKIEKLNNLDNFVV